MRSAPICEPSHTIASTSHQSGNAMLTRPAAAAGSSSGPNAMQPRRVFDDYALHPTAWDELFASSGQPHRHCNALAESLGELAIDEFQRRRTNADLVFINQGITFSVYSDRR